MGRGGGGTSSREAAPTSSAVVDIVLDSRQIEMRYGIELLVDVIAYPSLVGVESEGELAKQ